MVTGLGHVGIICDDLMKMRDFYTRVIDAVIDPAVLPWRPLWRDQAR